VKCTLTITTPGNKWPEDVALPVRLPVIAIVTDTAIVLIRRPFVEAKAKHLRSKILVIAAFRVTQVKQTQGPEVLEVRDVQNRDYVLDADEGGIGTAWNVNALQVVQSGLYTEWVIYFNHAMLERDSQALQQNFSQDIVPEGSKCSVS